jgi:hypothetical protein
MRVVKLANAENTPGLATFLLILAPIYVRASRRHMFDSSCGRLFSEARKSLR